MTTVAAIILAQLGGNRFIAMTGARDLVRNDNALSFKLPRGARNGINYVTVVLTPADLYNVTFYKMTRGLNVHTISAAEGVYADKLQATFMAATGLDTHL